MSGASLFGGRTLLLGAVLLGVFLVASPAASATVLPEKITENTTLTLAASPYTGSTTIESGVTVKVEPGVKFIGTGMSVNGTLTAEGSAEKPIVFTGAKEESPGEWGHIRFAPGSGASVIDHAELAYGGSGGVGIVYVEGSSPTITNSTIRKSWSGGIRVEFGGSPHIAYNNVLANAGAGIYYSAAGTQTGEINIHDNKVEGGTDGIYVNITSTGSVPGKALGANTIIKTTKAALFYKGKDIPGNITGNTLIENASNVITISSGTVAASSTWNNGGSPVKVEGSITVASGVTLKITKGVRLTGSPAMEVHGTLNVEGTAEEPVVFTGSKEAAPGEWGHIRFVPGSGASVIDHAELAYGGGGGLGIVYVEGSSPTITNSTIRKSYSAGIRVDSGGSPHIAYNNVLGNAGQGIVYSAAGTTTGEINIHDNFVEGGTDGIYVNITSSGSVVGKNLGANTIIKTTKAALFYKGKDIPGNITGNTLIENASNVITISSGTVAASSTWNNGGNPVKVEGGITVASGVTLKITKGVVLKGSPAMTVNGTLNVEGTASEPVVFTGTNESSPGEWGHIRFASGSGASVIDHAELKYGGSSGAGTIYVEGSSPTITNSTIRKSYSAGIRVEMGGSPHIANNNVLANAGYGIYYSAAGKQTGEINIHDNFVEGGTDGIYVNITSSGSVVGKSLGANTIVKTTKAALFYKGKDIPGNITGNTLIENASNVITISEGTVATTSTWNNGGSRVKVEGNIIVASGVTLKITKGVRLFGSPAMTIKGALKVEGTAEEPVIFTGSKEESPGEWGHLRFESGSSASVIDNAELAYGGSSGIGIVYFAEGSSPTITNSTIRKSSSSGIYVEGSGTPKIEWNRFRGNSKGLTYTGAGNLSAPNNDWGCANGPKPAGCGDSVTSNVKWNPAVSLPELNGQCRGQESQCGEGADPVSLATGQLSYSHRDLLLTNKSEVPLEFVRAYSSGSAADTGLGPGWSQTGLASATELASGAVLVVRQDGRQDLFYKTESGYKAPSGVTSTLAKVEGTFQLTTLEGTVYRFDASGRIASITDDHSLKTTYAYDANGRLATITDPSAQTLTFTYNASNHITAVKDSTGREVKYGYSAAGDLATVTDALSGVTEYTYDSEHRLKTIKDPRGNVILKNTYDGQGRITEQRDGLENLWKLEYKENETIVTEPEGGKLTYGFDGQKRVVSETDQLGNKTTRAYDEAGNVKEIVRPGEAKWSFGHDPAGNLTSVTDPKEGKRSYEYDAKSRLTSFTDAKGSEWSYEWSAANDLTKITDPESNEATLTYNESGQPLTVTDDNGHKSEFGYDTRGNRTSLTDPLSHKTSFEYDSRNYLISKTLPELKAETFERNALGDLLARTTPLGNKTKYIYDANGMPTQITDPGEGVWKIAYNAMGRPIAYTDPAEQQTTVAYNGNLRPTKVTNRRGKETTYAYDLANRLTKVSEPESEVWSFGYDARGNRTSLTDPRENKTTYEYDLLDRMIKANEPLSVSSEYGYDANGQLTSVKDPRGNTTTYTYDKLGRLTKVAQPLEKTTSYAYDGVGNLLTRTTAAGTLTYAYDAADRLEKVSTGETTLRSFGYDNADRLTAAIDAQGKKIEIAYDEDGRVASINDGRGQSLSRSYNSRGYLTKQVDGRGTLEHGYDQLGRLTSLTDPQAKVATFAYDAEGGLTEVKRPGGIVTTNVYDNAGRLSETTTKAGEPATVLDAFKYGYDAAGNVVSRIDTRLEQETKFAYDALSRLTEFNPPGEGSTSYGYDAAGNRTSAEGTTYTYNALNQLTESSDGATYGYDGAGRMTSRTKEAKETIYEWDLFDHLASVEGPSGATSYAYDALGRLSERTSGAGALVAHYGDLTDRPTYDANGAGETTTSYVGGVRGLLEQRSGGATSFPLRDAHGDITAIAGEAGEVALRQTYDPWGTQLSGSTVEMGYLGAQQRRTDPTTGLIQMGVRSYSPFLGRFITEDIVLGHLGVSISFDRYAYAWDNPVNLYDLDGRDVCVSTPFGAACAEDAAEDVGNAAGDVASAAWHTGGDAINTAGPGVDTAWDWTAPGRIWIGDRTRDFVKQINFSTEEFAANVATIIIGHGLCVTAGAGASAVGTPVAGTAATITCVAADSLGFASTVIDVFDDENELWPNVSTWE
jgi:RHS repeat-associated protein